MKNTSKKILALLLSVIMIFGCLGMTSLAADSVVTDDDYIITEDDDIIIDDDDIVADEEGEDEPVFDIADNDSVITNIVELVNMVVPGIYNFIASNVEINVSLEQVLKVAQVIAKLVYAIVVASV